MTTGSPSRLVVHVTTTDISLALLLKPQLLAYQQAGWRVIGTSAAGAYVSQLEAVGIEHIGLRHATRAMAPGQDALLFAELVSLFRRLRPDVVHTHNPKPGIYGRVAARVARVPAVVNTVHGLYATAEDSLAKRAVVYTAERLASTCSDVELVLNPEDAEVLYRLGVPRRKVTVLGSGVDLSFFDPARFDAAERAAVRREMGVPGDEVVVGVVGRLVREKGFGEVFEAARLLRSRAPNARVVCIGPEEPEKADRLTRSELDAAMADGVVWMGERSDMDRLYAGFDMYVLASYREGFPRAAMEAAAMGLPLVLTNIRGCRQVVDDGRNGFLVPPRDGGALAEAIAKLAADSELRSSMGAASRAKAEAEFDEAAIIKATLATYERLAHR